MATRTLTYKQITDASRLLDLDPDCYPSGVLEKVLWNRKALEPYRSTWQRKQMKVARRYAEREGEDIKRVQQEDDEENREGKEEGEEVHPLEAQMGVHLTDPVAANKEIGKQAQEQVEVDLATITLEEARQIETPNGEELTEMQQMDQWAFMLELE
jgi:hypothetical protein